MRDVLNYILKHDTHPIIQFIKYGLVGGLATLTDILVFYCFAWQILPALTADDWLVVLVNKFINLPVVPASEAVRGKLFLLDKSLSFIVSNFVCYVMNVLWVFKPGRHSRKKEFMLFYMVSIASFVVGTMLAWALIQFAHIMTTTAYVANIFASVMINYVCRKYIVFKG